MPAALELWGGVECSTVRIGDHWRDQVNETGHGRRAVADIALIAALGLRMVRYPALWERLTGDPAGWEWQDQQFAALQRHGIGIIAGLVHHGSGPPGTSLLDPSFGAKLAVHARQAAQRYPFVAAWTPINEPLTTARFGCLYGHWHPHAHDGGAFLRAVANQCHAALLAMRAIRAMSPGARFVHTEDVGRTFATAPVAEQAHHENERRWLSLDLLCGRVGRDHGWRSVLERHGVPAMHLDQLATGEAAPDLIGINYYATSDRYLDHRLALYPKALHGGNGRLAYADTEALRANLPTGVTGWHARLGEVWERYRRPMAVTEAHLGCEDRTESVRWLLSAWDAAQALRGQGADIRAVTAWALFGLMDWDSMLTKHRHHYEPGVLDASVDPPQPTPLAAAVSDLAKQGRHWHPELDKPGWWLRDDRIHASLRQLA